MSWNSYWKGREASGKAKEMRAVHPIWRGIGFLMMIVIPLFSFVLADLLIQKAIVSPNIDFSLPAELRGTMVIEALNYTVYNFKGVLAFAAVLSVLIFALFGVINALVFQMMGGSPTDKLNAPPERYKNRRKHLK